MNSPLKLVRPPIVCLKLKSRTKNEALAEMVSAVTERFDDFPGDTVLHSLKEREKLSTTGIGDGLAIPHCRMADLKDIHLAIGRNETGIEYDALDHKPVYLVILIAGPEHMATDLLRILAALSRVLREPANREFLVANDDPVCVGDFLDAQCHMS